jgi:tetratricopeptide (TPR) repeat protein
MKLSKKDLKTPDKIWVDMKKILEWLTEEVAVLIIAIAVLFIGSVVGVFVYQKKLSTEGKAQFHYAQAKSFAEQMKVMPEKEEKKPSKSAEQMKAERTKAEADLKAELSVLEREFSNSKANQMAEMLRGQLASEGSNWLDAAKHYELYSKSLSGTDRSLGLYPLAQAQEQAGQFDASLKSYSEIVDLKGSAHIEWAMLGKARVLKALNRNEDAKKTYESFLSAYPNSAEASNVRGMMSSLGSTN